MLADGDAQAFGVGMDMMRARQPLGAALVWSELLRGGMRTAELYCGLGSALMQSRGQLVRRPFELWAGKVFNRGAAEIAAAPAYAETLRQWAAELPEMAEQGPLADAEVGEMIEFLLVHEQVLPQAVAALPEADRMGAVMALGDRGDPLYVPLLRQAIEGLFGGGAARAAAKRVGRFLDRPDMQASIEAARDTPIAEELGPYLRALIGQLPAGWDAPRTRACPPYRGIGRIDIELVSAGPQPKDCAELLRAHMAAGMRDAVSWVQFTPCVIKKGAMRSDALTVKRMLEPAGATLKLHGFTWSHESQPSEVRPTTGSFSPANKPWWKFWGT